MHAFDVRSGITTRRVPIQIPWTLSILRINTKTIKMWPPCDCDTFLVSFVPISLLHVAFLWVLRPIRNGRPAGQIESELNFGVRKKVLNLNPTKSIYYNEWSYKYNPCEKYSKNALTTRRYVFPFLNGTWNGDIAAAENEYKVHLRKRSLSIEQWVGHREGTRTNHKARAEISSLRCGRDAVIAKFGTLNR